MEHVVKRGEYLSLIARKYSLSLNQLLAANPRYKADPNTINVGARLEIPSSPASSSPQPPVSTGGDDDFIVPYGQLTFDAEGMEKPGRYFSRKPHVPGASSGVTIGRGYDMKERSKAGIIEDLQAAGVPQTKAKKLSRCSGLQGKKAKQFLQENGLESITISPLEQKKLFLLVYQELAGDVLRICRKADVVAKYGEVDWSDLNPKIRDIAVDLRYRGDYTPATREKVQPILVVNELKKLKTLMANEDYWVEQRSVPRDRFRRRSEYLQ